MVRNPYGEAAIAMGALLRDRGVQDVLVYGTAASLDRNSQVGELHLPSRATSARASVVPLASATDNEHRPCVHSQGEGQAPSSHARFV